ncbi:Wzz/FepE/Etk N-terminal domain-containing protein [Glacieibacterium megasporae]|uniref:Wzz/FepE/Etk N-terminal domain-containing protein n=1 Tax=Glacieibacterium megasporae TaxID=2835787 RepID=UPI001CAA67BE|nr:Wzz/FepE/Etk N-terminal domain-containing protein [Polymorphobacter megasporae]UAJ10489.1 hypothetical protein KTC28_01620 [Polymorphobacter megasporae]
MNTGDARFGGWAIRQLWQLPRCGAIPRVVLGAAGTGGAGRPALTAGLIDWNSMSTPLQSDEIVEPNRSILIDWIQALRRRKFLGLALLIVFVGAAIVYLHIATYKYAAILTVTPADQNAPKATGGLASISTIVGVDLNNQGGPAFGIYAEAVTSYPVAEKLSRNEALMRAIFSQSWDASQRQWREPHSALRSLSVTVKSLLGVPIKPWQPPGASELQAYIQKSIVVLENKKKPFIQLSYENEDPQFAAELLRETNAATDNFLRQRSLTRAAIYVRYLEQRLAQIQVEDYRVSVLQALSTYEKTRMMASVDASFAAESFGGIWVSPNFTTPNPWLVLLLAVVLALVVWIALAIAVLPLFSMIRRSIRRQQFIESME